MPLRGVKSQNLAGRDIVSIFDLSDADILSVFGLADEMEHFCRGRTTLGQDKILASLFYEPSTRTRFSFEAAMLRLGGGVISCADVSASSVAKGETLADTIRILHSYADVIIIRHPLEGSARAAADYSTVPVINAGDGAHEHPTQTLLDLYTIRKEKGVIAGVNVALVGDLKHGRTAHSLAFGLARFGAKITCVAPKG
jgi:aspartate carbamoyltransferase catalytic subunit